MLSFFPLDVLDEIWDVIESVSEGFLTYAFYLLGMVKIKFTSSWALTGTSCELILFSIYPLQ